MAYRNPYYDPNWKAVHDRHREAAQRAQEETERLAAGGAETYAAYKEMEGTFTEHHQACLSSFRMQHETVQEYATWLFQDFPVTMGIYDVAVPVLQVDFETLRTMEDAYAAWSRSREMATESAGEQRNSMPVGQPEGLTAFADATSPSLTRTWREFTPRELYPSGYPGEAGVWTLLTIDQQVDGWHVCFMQHWNSQGISVTNAIERLASAIYREACAIAERQPKLEEPRNWFTRPRGHKVSAPLNPTRFHFYDHTPPKGSSDIREAFSRVSLRFEDGEFKRPEWQHYQIVPRIIQSGRFDLARSRVYSNQSS